EYAVAVASHDDLVGIRIVIVPTARNAVDAVIENHRSSIDLIEKRRQVAAAHFIGDLEEVAGAWMPELPAIEERGEDPLHCRPPQRPLERVKPKGRLCV